MWSGYLGVKLPATCKKSYFFFKFDALKIIVTLMLTEYKGQDSEILGVATGHE